MRKGFTLIELLVAISMIGLLTTISVATVVSAKQKRQAKVVAEQIRNFLYEAHAYAISPKTATTTGDIDITITEHSIAAKVGSEDIIKPVYFSSKVSLNCSGSGKCFSYETSEINKIGQLKTPIRQIVAESNGEKYQAKVDQQSGNVRIEKL